ncbi:MAG: peptide chain release factor N(5)-glutamine methyltransferase [Roseiflexaceae bacterium]|nr:peptide chain release factor N(5)-glutamine methyltransferase [Roseiflexaceae bacterium]
MKLEETIAAALGRAVQALAEASPTPRLDAELLLAHTLGWSRAQLLAEGRQALTLEQQAAFSALIERRRSLEPVAYLIGQREFYGLQFEVTPDTLVPRPETELLVDLALELVGQRTKNREQRTKNKEQRTENREQSPIRAADVGTGTGCIAVAFALNCPQAQVLAVDISAAALAVAGRNLARHGLEQRVTLIEGDLLAALNRPVDLLLSNPPYVIMAEIDENVRRHEPHLALDGGLDGLDVYRRLLAQAPAKLLPGGAIVLEIGAWQAAAVMALGAAHFPGARITVHRDLAGLDRVVVIETNDSV